MKDIYVYWLSVACTHQKTKLLMTRSWCLPPSWGQDIWCLEEVMYVTIWLEAGFHGKIKNTYLERAVLQHSSTLSNSLMQKTWWDSRKNFIYYFSKEVTVAKLGRQWALNTCQVPSQDQEVHSSKFEHHCRIRAFPMAKSCHRLFLLSLITPTTYCHSLKHSPGSTLLSSSCHPGQSYEMCKSTV